MKNYLIAFVLGCVCHASWAETCPSVSDIKHQSLVGWRAYDNDTGTPLSENQSQALKDHIDEFTLAEWSNTRGVVHCYYRDKNGSDLEAYFAKEHLKPALSGNVWYQVSGHLHCAAGMSQCVFENNASTPNHLATK